MNRNRDGFSVVRVGAYCIRPTNGHIGGRTDQNLGVFFVRRCTGKGCLGGCELLLFVGKIKIGGVFLAFLSPFLVLTGGKETKESQFPAGGVFFVRYRSGKGCLGWCALFLFVGKMRIGGVWVQIFLRDGERAN